MTTFAIGPIFPTATKGSTDPFIGIETLPIVRDILGPIPLVAIGGLTLENSKSVLDAGADAVAVISDIWRSTQPAALQIKRFLELR